METALIIHYGLVFLMLVFMEGILSADNALVLAVMVKPLRGNWREKALFYGLLGAIVLRFLALFAISFLANVWQAQAVGAAYLIFMSVRNLKQYHDKKVHPDDRGKLEKLRSETAPKNTRKDFWLTVLKVELADIAFAVDSILAAVAIAMALPNTGLGHIGGLDTAKFMLVLLGGLSGVVIMRFAASFFVKLLDKRPKLEVAAFLLVFWVGIKLVVVTLAHPEIHWLPETFPESTLWHVVFFGTMILIAVWGWVTSKPGVSKNDQAAV